MAGATTDRFWGRKSFVLITGASRGIGRAIAVEFAKNVAKDSVIVITARTASGLEETRGMIEASAKDVEVIAETLDHATASYHDYEQLLTRAAKHVANPEEAVLVHNAATMGDVTKYAASYDDAQMIGDYFHLNLTAIMSLTSAFLKRYGPDIETTRTLIVNITSIAGRTAFPGVGLYCSGKAAREMYLNVLAIENPMVKVLHYHPGIVKTDMLAAAMENSVPELQPILKDFNAKAVDPETTATMLVNVLSNADFESGSYVDYSVRAAAQ